MAWVSFCISTYKRPQVLRTQLELLSRQTFTDFEVVVSDNDPEGSAREIVGSFRDSRFHYYHNDENLGMIRSFNKSIERANTPFIVMVTDDDPVHSDFLEEMYSLYSKYPGYSVYGGFTRKMKKAAEVEIITAQDFLPEILDPGKTTNILWSSSVMDRSDVLAIHSIPDYGSPHLADHALTTLTGCRKGAVIINKMYSSLTSHDANYSKSNFESYEIGCNGFYQTLSDHFSSHNRLRLYQDIIQGHLGYWLIVNVFSLKKYFTLHKNKEKLLQVDAFATKVLQHPYFKKIKTRFFLKNLVFRIKVIAGMLN